MISESNRSSVLYCFFINGKNIFSWLLNMIVDKILLKEFCHSDVKPSPLKNDRGLFSIFILFYLFPFFTSQIWEKYVLSTIPKHGKGKECSFVGYLRRIIAQFKICDAIKISFFLISVSFLAGEPNFTFLFSISVSKGK